MLRHITQQGDEQQRQWAWQTLITSEQMRGQREAMTFIAAIGTTRTGGKERTVYDARNGGELPGKVVRAEGGKRSKDPAVNEAYDGAGATYDLYQKVYGRRSIDDKGLPLDSTVHYRRNYDNAFWNGRQMVYGDGDGQLFQRFTKAIDVIGHELTHGVTQYEANLDYQDQAGALNESMSDVFGTLVKQYKKQQSVKDADWLIGQGLLTPNVKGVALRSMKAPGTAYDDPVLGKDPQPAHMRDYVNTHDDNGGVHINSGIPNKAFYAVAMRIGGHAWEKAGQIWYVTLRDKLRPNSNFQDAAGMTYAVAGELFGKGSLAQKAVKAGWAEVGIKVR
jgi:Zn-dependent metalloprotease